MVTMTSQTVAGANGLKRSSGGSPILLDKERLQELAKRDFRAATDFQAATEYATDFWQRSLLFLDILRQSGNQQAEMTSRPINAVAGLRLRGHPARDQPAPTGELCPGARRAATGHGHRPYQATGRRDRPACRPGAGHRRLQAGKRDRSSLQSGPSGLLHRLQLPTRSRAKRSRMSRTRLPCSSRR